jgi:L-asparaginase
VALTAPVTSTFGTAAAGPAPRLLLLYTGGTIGMIQGPGGVLRPLDLSSLSTYVTRPDDVTLRLTTVAFDPPLDSSDIGPDDWVTIAQVIADQYDEHDGFVVLHGTDTMAYTASALSFILDGLDKPVVLTGSQVPITKVRSDGRENLVTALAMAAMVGADGRPAVPEVGLYFDTVLLRGNRSRKANASAFHAFESPNLPPLATAGIGFDIADDLIRRPPAGAGLTVTTSLEPSVASLKLFAGMAEESVTAVLSRAGLRGVVMESFGAGNAPTSPWFLDALRAASDRGVVIVNVTQCGAGAVAMGLYETSRHLTAAGVVSGGDMTFEAAVTKLMVLLGRAEPDEVRRQMPLDLAGEISPSAPILRLADGGSTTAGSEHPATAET